MANEIEILEKLQRRVTLTIAVNDINKEFEVRLKKQARTARAPGFRPGKVPLKMVQAQYGARIRTEVINDSIFDAFEKIAREKELMIAGYPRFAPNQEKNTDDTMAFDATFEVYPEIKMGNLGEVDVEKAVVNIDAAEVEKTIDTLRRRQAHYHERGESSEHGDGGANQAAQDGDRVTIDFEGRIDGVAFEGGKADNYSFVLGMGQMLPEFENAVRGLKKGENKVFPLTFPEDYHGKDVAGKKAEFTVTLQKVEWAHLPEVNADFAKQLGVEDGDIQKMREEIERNLKLEAKNRVAALNKSRVMEALLKATTFDVPRALIDDEIRKMVETVKQDAVDRRLDMKNADLPPDLYEKEAEKRVRLGLIFMDFIKNDDFKVSDDDVRARAEEIGSSYQDPKMIVDYYMNDKDRRQELEALVMEDKVVDYVLKNAKTVEKQLPFSDLMARPSL